MSSVEARSPSTPLRLEKLEIGGRLPEIGFDTHCREAKLNAKIVAIALEESLVLPSRLTRQLAHRLVPKHGWDSQVRLRGVAPRR